MTVRLPRHAVGASRPRVRPMRPMRPMLCGGLAGLVLGAVAGPAVATDLPVEDPPAAYAACMARTETAPRQAFGAAVAWQGLGGGAPARHCAAMALYHLAAYPDAAERLEALARDSRGPSPLRLDLLAQAAAAWTRAGDPARAEAVLSAALGLARRAQQAGDPPPQDRRAIAVRLPDLLIDRAAAHAGSGRDREAVADLDQALALRPGDPDALAARASARRRLGALEAAAADLDSLLAQRPNDPAARLEQGNVLRLQGRPAEARAAWMRALAVAEPDSPEAAAARENLARLDVRLPDGPE